MRNIQKGISEHVIVLQTSDVKRAAVQESFVAESSGRVLRLRAQRLKFISGCEGHFHNRCLLVVDDWMDAGHPWPGASRLHRVKKNRHRSKLFARS